MSEARKCDRCHVYFELSKEEQKNRHLPYDMKGTYVKIMLFGRYGEVENSVRFYDLCPNCVELLDKWLENKARMFPNLPKVVETKSSSEAVKLNEYGCPHYKCCDCPHFSEEPNPFNIHNHKGIYKCNDKNIYISGNCSRPPVSDMTPMDFCNLGCNFVKDDDERVNNLYKEAEEISNNAGDTKKEEK